MPAAGEGERPSKQQNHVEHGVDSVVPRRIESTVNGRDGFWRRTAGTLVSCHGPTDRAYDGYDAALIFGTNDRKRFGFSTMILWMVVSFTPAYRSLGRKMAVTEL